MPLRSSHSDSVTASEGSPRAGELGDGFEDQLMIAAIEVVGDQAIGDRVPGAVVEHQAAEHRLLRFDRVRRHPDLVDRSLVAGATRARRLQPWIRFRPSSRVGLSPTYSSATIVTGRSTVTSVCRCSCTMCSPAWRIGPCGRRTSERSTSKPALRSRLGDVGGADRAEQLAFAAGLRGQRQLEALAASPRAPAPPTARRRAAFSSSARRASNLAMLSAVASVALPCGSRKLRP